MRIGITSVFVDDQAEAERFYTGVLGFEIRQDLPLGTDRWLTVAPPGRPEIELLLEPAHHPAVKPYRDALAADGIPLLMLFSDDVRAEVDRLERAGVHFTQPPQAMGDVTTAVFDDTCGNLVVLVQQS
ncbi:VOC family protein [Nakamurella flava]|uniref:VOC family protein n=1 Tax=Nakamurella flava TaxID=2576308 RepID=A0A4V6CSN0_9ACTN|nr:VOC family protein [Nakamurella flava]